MTFNLKSNKHKFVVGVIFFMFIFSFIQIKLFNERKMLRKMRDKIDQNVEEKLQKLQKAETTEAERSVSVEHISAISHIDEVTIKNRISAYKGCDDLLLGRLAIKKTVHRNYKDIAEAVDNQVKDGCYAPTHCPHRQNVAVIIPYKDRATHLTRLLFYLHPIMIMQNIRYCIFVAEQYDDGQFNKAMIMNAAFKEATRDVIFDCVIFHDVDMIPEDSRNLYICENDPRHLSPAIDKYGYKPNYGTHFGGVVAISPEQYRDANGHSNRFWGWGGEDNDMEFRLARAGMNISTSSLDVGRYQMIAHHPSMQFSPAMAEHLILAKTAEARASVDGLSDLKYRLDSRVVSRFFIKFVIDIRRIEVNKVLVYMDGRKVDTIVPRNDNSCWWDRFEGKTLAEKIERPNSTSLLTFDEAAAACINFVDHCHGIVKENILGKPTFELRTGISPHYMVLPTNVNRIKKDENGEMKKMTEKKYIYSNKTSYIYNCPGAMNRIHSYKTPILLTPNTPIHLYRIEVHFTRLQNFSAKMFYRDSMVIENKEKLPTNGATQFRFYMGKELNFTGGPLKYGFSTRQLDLPSLPGSFMATSKLIDENRQPYFQWKWWFETTTGDRQKDAIIRHDFYVKLNLKRMEDHKQAQLHHLKDEMKIRNMKNMMLKGKSDPLFLRNMWKLRNK